MRRTKFFVMVMTLCVFASLSVKTQTKSKAAKPSPDKVVAELYKQHNKATPLFQTRSRVLLDKFFDKQLADLLWKDANTVRNEVGPLNGDPLYNAQDMDIKDFTIGKAIINEGTAQVIVSFTNFDRKEEIRFDLTSSKGGWKVANLTYQDGTTLAGILKGYTP